MVNTFKKGFTLIELMIVIAIIGLLASIVLASLSSGRSKSKDASVKLELKQLSTQIEKDYGQNYNTAFSAPNTLAAVSPYSDMATALSKFGSSLTVVTNASLPITQYAIYAPLVTDPTKFACIDSTGAVTAVAPGSNSVTCATATATPSCSASPNPVSSYVNTGSTVFTTITATGGSGTYTSWSVSPGWPSYWQGTAQGGSGSSVTAAYYYGAPQGNACSGSCGVSTVTVTDSLGHTGTCTVNVN